MPNKPVQNNGSPQVLVDAHHHLWDLSAHRYPWLQDAMEPGFFLGDYSALRQDYLPNDYLRDTQNQRVIATVHVEAERAHDDQLGETAWLHEVNAGYGFPDAVVAHAWFHTPDAEEIVAAQAAFPLVRGIRSKPLTRAHPGAARLQGPGTMQDQAWLRGFSLLERYGLTWDLRVPYWHLAEAADVARQFPRTPIVLNHIGFPWDRSTEGLAAWRLAMEQLARQPNVHVKVSELGLRDSPWTIESNRRVVLDTIAIFGMDRCMFASNFPVAGLRIGYDGLVAGMQDILHDFSANQHDAFFCHNALSFYRITKTKGNKP